MRVLMLAPAYPFPADDGAKRRIASVARHVARRHDLTLVSLGDAAPEAAPPGNGAERWRNLVVPHHDAGRLRTAVRACFTTRSFGQVRYWNAELQAVVDRLLATERFDCVWIHMLHMAPYAGRLLRLPPGSARPVLVLDQHNVDEQYFRSFLGSTTDASRKAFAALEMLKARRAQERWFPAFDAILCVSEDDLCETARFVDGRTGLVLAPNGVDLEYFAPIDRGERRRPDAPVVFGGSLDATMNQHAVRWFLERVFPEVARRRRGTRFWIVGRNPTPALRALASGRGATITGTVADVREYYRRAGVFVVPLHMGGGTKLKTLEAMAMALPIVSTRVGAQGLDVQSGRHLHVADDPEAFAAGRVSVVSDVAGAAALGAAARRLVERRYAWDRILDEVDRELTARWRERGSARRRGTRTARASLEL
jgi:glycosyltransferase involved in cell wall biosynthesis